MTKLFAIFCELIFFFFKIKYTEIFFVNKSRFISKKKNIKNKQPSHLNAFCSTLCKILVSVFAMKTNKYVQHVKKSICVNKWYKIILKLRIIFYDKDESINNYCNCEIT